MKILYLKPERGRPFFYADPSELAGGESERPTGLLGWAERKWADVEARWKGSDGSVARWSRRAWEWLLTWKRPDEELLARIGPAGAIVVHHPASLPPKKARAAWKRYLASRARSHLLWLIVDGLLAPITGLLFWLVPGPNVVGFWFTYRAFNHYTIVRSLHRARWKSPPPTFEADPALDAPVGRHGEGDAPGHPAVEDADRLRDHLERRDPEDDAAEPHDDHDAHDRPDARRAGRA